MGLDGVELVLAVEEEFELVISDAEAENTTTPGKLTDLVYSKLRQSREDPCQSQQAFYILRKKLIDILGIRRDQIRPDTSLNEIIPEENRIDTLKEIVNSISDSRYYLYTKTTKLSSRIKFSIYASVLAVFFSIFFSVLFSTELSLQFNFFISSIASLIVMHSLISLTTRYKTEFIPDFFTVADLTHIIGSRQSKIWDREELWEKIKEIIVEQLGVQEEEVLPDADFIKDLGMD